jgi:hypothetical protein
MPIWLLYVFNLIQAAPSLISIFNSVNSDVQNGTVPPAVVPPPTAGSPQSALAPPVAHTDVLAQINQNYKALPKAQS